jgi:hypothetical protein
MAVGVIENRTSTKLIVLVRVINSHSSEPKEFIIKRLQRELAQAKGHRTPPGTEHVRDLEKTKLQRPAILPNRQQQS